MLPNVIESELERVGVWLFLNLVPLAIKISQIDTSHADNERNRSRPLKLAAHPNESDLPLIAKNLARERSVRDGPVVR